MNVAWVVPYPVYGGPHNHAHRIAPYLLELDVSTCVVVPDEPGNAVARLRASGHLEVVALPMHRMRATLAPRPHFDLVTRFNADTRGLAQMFRRRHIDVVVQSSLIPPHAAIAARRAGLPLVCQIVDTRAPSIVAAVGMEVVRRCADRAMFCGESLLPWHVGDRPLQVPAEVFYPPVDTLRFVASAERRSAARADWNIPRGAPVIGMVGNLNPQKGWEYFVRAAAMVYRDVPQAYFLMVGASYDVKYRGLIDREIDASGVPRERFKMTGERMDVEVLLAAMDVALITSVLRSEGAPTTGLEAMACGVPVVGVAVGAIPEFVLDGETGLLVEPLNPAAIAVATVRLLAEPDLRARMGACGRALVVSRFDARSSAEQHHRAFEAARAHHAERSGQGRFKLPPRTRPRR